MIFGFKTKFNSVIDALRDPNACKTLELRFVKTNLEDEAHYFFKLKNIKTLFIQGDYSIFDVPNFELPKEIGDLETLEKLTLLNLPLSIFPDWLFKLKRLKYLMVRGTDITKIPSSIKYLQCLETLRIENCPLKVLPIELNQLIRLKSLGLSDSRLTTIDINTLPIGLKNIQLAGTTLYNADITIGNKKLKHEFVD